MWPLGIVQRFLESAISKISITFWSLAERRKTTPPAVGSRTTSLITGCLRRTNLRIPENGLGLFIILACFILLLTNWFLIFLLAQNRAQNAIYELGGIVAAKG